MSEPLPIRRGDVIAGKFQVERVLGAGGAGMVVAARHLQLGESVALKFLLPEAIQNTTDVERFLREAQASVRMKNEHVARVIDVGTLEGGAPYMVMECLHGTDLGRHLETYGPLGATDAVDYVLQACEAVAEAHHLGIVHRDLKPSNLFLTHRPDGTPLVKVLDFGIAKAATELESENKNLTRTRSLLGSPVYMSPEQVRSARSVDHRTDIWSLGVCLFELLTADLPFDGDSVTGVAAAVATDPVPPLRAARPDLPQALEAVVERCLIKDVEQRFQSVSELADALAPFASEVSLICVERVAGTLGLRRPKLASVSSETTGSASTRTSGATLATSTTVHGRTVQRTSPWMWGAGALFGALALAVGVTAVTTLRDEVPQTNSGRANLDPETMLPPPMPELPSVAEVGQSVPPPVVAPRTSASALSAAADGAPEPSADPAVEAKGGQVFARPVKSGYSHPVRRRAAAVWRPKHSKPASRAKSAQMGSKNSGGILDSTVDTRR